MSCTVDFTVKDRQDSDHSICHLSSEWVIKVDMDVDV